MNTMVNTCLHRHSVLLQLFEMVLGFVYLYQPFCTLAINTVGVLMLTKNILFCLEKIQNQVIPTLFLSSLSSSLHIFLIAMLIYL